MTGPSNKSILLLSEDITIIESIYETFNNCNIEKFNQKDDFSKYNLIILDDYKLDENTLNEILSNSNVLNISKNKYSNVYNLDRPFSLNNLFSSINEILINDDKILKFKNFAISNNILQYNNEEIDFGSKEIFIIKFLYNNKIALKSALLKEIWGYNEDMETKVLENTINKIRQKFKSLNIENFIIFDDGKYYINKDYLI